MLFCGSLSASLCMVSLCFSCSTLSSGLFFQQECLLTGLLSNCSIALFIISWNSLMNSSLSALWLTSNKFFIICLFWITFVILRWLFCLLSLLYFVNTLAWLSCHFMSLCWQASQDLLLCAQWNFFQPPFFHYSFCNIPDILCVWDFLSRFPYCPCIASQCGSLLLTFLSVSLLTTIHHVFTCCHMLGHTSLYDAIDWFFSNAITVFPNTSKIS